MSFSFRKVLNGILKRNLLIFLIIPIIFIGTILRIISLLAIPIASDSLCYIQGAEDILIGIYTTHREPGFSLYIVPFLLIFKDSSLAIKFASFTSGILLIFTSFIVFSKASIRFFERDKNGYSKSNLIALSVSLCISIQNYLVYNNGRGLREETISLLLLLIFYYIIVNQNGYDVKTILVFFFLVTFLNLVHLTAGIFTFLSFISFLFISKTKYIEFKFSNTIIITYIVSFICSILYWLIFCGINFGNPFSTFDVNQSTMNGTYNVILHPWNEAIETIRFALIYGIIIELSIFFTAFGIIFGSIILFSIMKFYRKQQIQFLSVLLFINFIYISIYIAYVRSPRLIIYFFPFLFYIGFLLLIEIIYKKKEIIFVSFNAKEKEVHFNFIYIFYLLALYFIVYSITEISSFIINNRSDLTATFGILNSIEDINHFSFFSNYIFYISLIVFIPLLLIPSYVDLNETRKWNLNRKSIYFLIIITIIIILLTMIIYWCLTGEKYSPNMR